MKKITTILCSICFMICGIAISGTYTNSPPNLFPGNQTAYAQQQSFIPQMVKFDVSQLPLDLQLGQVEEKVPDTVYITKTDTIKEQVTKVKWRQAPAPDPIIKVDTIQVPVYYLATQVGIKEEPTDTNQVILYEVHKIENYGPDQLNSSDIRAYPCPCDTIH